ncbi:MAG: hypothetical protein U9N73_00155 [Candidatus Auribacterota bacterium]|nr:hypothetical protein [Candidatus Auribacterota bacterium]
MVTEKSREIGATAVTDLKTDWESNWQTVTLIFWLKEAQASGNAVILPPGEEVIDIPDYTLLEKGFE